MKNAEFVALVIANAQKTARIRAYSGHWYTGASRVPDKISNQVGHVIGLLQAQLEKGQFCQPDECLLIYNFQIFMKSELHLYLNLDMLIKPLADINNTLNKDGRPLQLVISGTTGEVMNSSKAMIALDLINLQELKEEGLDLPTSYGCYQDYPAICSFVALTYYRPLDNELQKVFEGQFDHSELLQKSKVFDSFVEARDSLKESRALGRYVGELLLPKEEIATMKKQRIGQYIIKIIDPWNIQVTVTPLPEVRDKEVPMEDEVNRLHEALKEPEIESIELSL